MFRTKTNSVRGAFFEIKIPFCLTVRYRTKSASTDLSRFMIEKSGRWKSTYSAPTPMNMQKLALCSSNFSKNSPCPRTKKVVAFRLVERSQIRKKAARCRSRNHPGATRGGFSVAATPAATPGGFFVGATPAATLGGSL